MLDFLKYIVCHTPKEKLNNDEINQIKRKGLIHICEKKNLDSIVKEGVKGNLKKPMFRKEKGYTWFYIFDEKELEDKIKIIHEKGERKNCDAYVVIKGLSEKQISKLRIRRNPDAAVIYPGTLYTDNIEKYLLK